METLPLDLNKDKAAVLILLLDTSLDSLNYKGEILKQVKELPADKRPDELKDEQVLNDTMVNNEALILDGIAMIKEVSKILEELDGPNAKPETIITKPFWDGHK